MTTSPNAPSSSLSEDEDDQEINVDSGHEDEGCCQEEDDCSSLDAGSCGPGAILNGITSPTHLYHTSTNTTHTNTSPTGGTAPFLPFSISRLLGEEDHKSVGTSILVDNQTGPGGGGVIRVPAQRIPQPSTQQSAAAQAGPLPPAPFPWGLVHPAAVIHNSAAAAAAAAAFASHAIKERLSGEYNLLFTIPTTSFPYL
ncbi:hypothetical protein O3M35_012093 [Rhynocoris fuscipes]|uniref:Uncharacterized protein n=1 Tax=Rhynocoris fuscipes TaxID=488301 RepID=A0AAW1CXL3_9HEMI